MMTECNEITSWIAKTIYSDGEHEGSDAGCG